MELTDLLAASAASDEFKTDVLTFATRRAAPRIQLARRAPSIKVLRVLMQLLSEHPELEIEQVTIEARSGCSDYVGRLRVHGPGSVREFEFAWDCEWRAVEQGWRDAFGFPDQIRAAHVFDWRCFRLWHEIAPSPGELPPALAN